MHVSNLQICVRLCMATWRFCYITSYSLEVYCLLFSAFRPRANHVVFTRKSLFVTAVFFKQSWCQQKQIKGDSTLSCFDKAQKRSLLKWSYSIRCKGRRFPLCIQNKHGPNALCVSHPKWMKNFCWVLWKWVIKYSAFYFHQGQHNNCREKVKRQPSLSKCLTFVFMFFASNRQPFRLIDRFNSFHVYFNDERQVGAWTCSSSRHVERTNTQQAINKRLQARNKRGAILIAFNKIVQ